MQRLISCLSLAALLLPSASLAAPTVDEVVAGIQSFYQTATDLKADFTQTYTYKVYARKQVSKGAVYFKKPRKMRWDYKSPQPKVFVADGKTLWVYEPEENQVFKRSLNNSQLPVALTFMGGEGDLSAEFNTALVDDPDEKTWLVELVPKKDAGDYQKLHLRVDRATFAVQSSTVIDPVGNINHVAFGGVQTNAGLPDSGFVFVPPEGVRVIGGAPRK
jgi:outer membrane lipoprotein carrier protein